MAVSLPYLFLSNVALKDAIESRKPDREGRGIRRGLAGKNHLGFVYVFGGNGTPHPTYAEARAPCR